VNRKANHRNLIFAACKHITTMQFRNCSHNGQAKSVIAPSVTSPLFSTEKGFEQTIQFEWVNCRAFIRNLDPHPLCFSGNLHGNFCVGLRIPNCIGQQIAHCSFNQFGFSLHRGIAFNCDAKISVFGQLFKVFRD